MIRIFAVLATASALLGAWNDLEAQRVAVDLRAVTATPTQRLAGTDLSAEQTSWAMGEMLSGEATPVQVAGFAVALRAKGETSAEVLGLVDAMYAVATPLSIPGRLLLSEQVPPWVRAELGEMGYDLDYAARTSGPINAIWFDREHGTMWGASSDYGEDYGIAW